MKFLVSLGSSRMESEVAYEPGEKERCAALPVAIAGLKFDLKAYEFLEENKVPHEVRAFLQTTYGGACSNIRSIACAFDNKQEVKHAWGEACAAGIFEIDVLLQRLHLIPATYTVVDAAKEKIKVGVTGQETDLKVAAAKEIEESKKDEEDDSIPVAVKQEDYQTWLAAHQRKLHYMPPNSAVMSLQGMGRMRKMMKKNQFVAQNVRKFQRGLKMSDAGERKTLTVGAQSGRTQWRENEQKLIEFTDPKGHDFMEHLKAYFTSLIVITVGDNVTIKRVYSKKKDADTEEKVPWLEKEDMEFYLQLVEQTQITYQLSPRFLYLAEQEVREDVQDLVNRASGTRVETFADSRPFWPTFFSTRFAAKAAIMMQEKMSAMYGDKKGSPPSGPPGGGGGGYREDGKGKGSKSKGKGKRGRSRSPRGRGGGDREHGGNRNRGEESFCTICENPDVDKQSNKLWRKLDDGPWFSVHHCLASTACPDFAKQGWCARNNACPWSSMHGKCGVCTNGGKACSSKRHTFQEHLKARAQGKCSRKDSEIQQSKSFNSGSNTNNEAQACAQKTKLETTNQKLESEVSSSSSGESSEDDSSAADEVPQVSSSNEARTNLIPSANDMQAVPCAVRGVIQAKTEQWQKDLALVDIEAEEGRPEVEPFEDFNPAGLEKFSNAESIQFNFPLLGQEKFHSMGPRQAVIDPRWWKQKFKSAAVCPDTGLEFADLVQLDEELSGIQFHPKKHMDRYAPIDTWVKRIYKRPDKIAKIRNFLTDKILIHSEGPRLSWAHALFAICRGARSAQECLMWLKSYFETEMKSWLGKIANVILDKEDIKTEFDAQVVKATLAAEREFQMPLKHLFDLPEELQEIFEKLREQCQGMGYSSQPKMSSAEEPLVPFADLVKKHLAAPKDKVKEVENENMQEYLDRAIKTQHPFRQPIPVDDDIYESAFVAGLEKSKCQKLRKEYFQKLDRLARIVKPFYDEINQSGKSLRARRPVHCTRVGPAQNPLLMAVLGPAVGYGDSDAPWLVFWGAKILGRLESCSVMRKNVPKELEREIYEMTPKDNKIFVDKVHNMLLKVDTDVEAQTILFEKNFQELDNKESKYMQREEIEDFYPAGTWRMMIRHVVFTAEKYREIDSGKFSKHNAACLAEDRISVAACDTVDHYVALQKLMWDKLPKHLRSRHFRPGGGTEDMKRAYRQCPVRSEDIPYSISAFQDLNNGVGYVQLYSLCFGLVAAVLAFNRVAQWMRTILRRCIKLVCASYFDDYVQIENMQNLGQAKEIMWSVFNLFGFRLDKNKSKGPSPRFKWLGTIKVLGQTCVVTSITTKRIKKMKEFIESALERGTLTPSEAGSLRGKFGWASVGLYGRVGRISLRSLILRQYFDKMGSKLPGKFDKTEEDPKKWPLTIWLRASLEWMLSLLAIAPKACFHMDDFRRPLYVIFSDASSEESRKMKSREYKQFLKNRGIANGRKVQLGWVSFLVEEESHSKVDWGWHQVAEEILTFWKKEQPICLGESLACITAVWRLLQNKIKVDILIFVDNRPAAGSLVKGSSRDCELDHLAQLFQLILAKHQARAWIEYVPSALNCSDELSRIGSFFKLPAPKCPLPSILQSGKGALAVAATLAELKK